MSDEKQRGWTPGPDSHELYVDAMEAKASELAPASGSACEGCGKIVTALRVDVSGKRYCCYQCAFPGNAECLCCDLGQPPGMKFTRIEMLGGKPVRCFIEDKPNVDLRQDAPSKPKS